MTKTPNGVAFIDAATMNAMRETRDGFLVGNALVARTGIQVYAGHEIGRPELDVVNVYRPESSVFAKDSMASFVGKPICDDHPDEVVNSDNWKDYAGGSIGEEIARDGEALRISVALMDAELIKKVKDGKRELSVGYRAELDWIDGVTPAGEPYQAIQRDIFVDHVAVVDKGRAGPEFRIPDAKDGGKDRKQWGAAPITLKAKEKEPIMADLQAVVLGDEAVNVPSEVAPRIKAHMDKLTRDHNAVVSDMQEKSEADQKALDEKEGEIAALKEKLKKAKISPEEMSMMVRNRAALMDVAKKNDVEAKEDESEEEIKRKIVGKKMGDEALNDASADTINGMYRVIASETKDGFSYALSSGVKTQIPNEGFCDAVIKRSGLKMKEA